ncbi:MAG: HAMP domain-containing histidine kinase [Calditrichaceae bacterium]|nr:HAMP domain-containing histidine kinase [Calditrichaceae bacterium]RQV96762.1 MAG: sensor histidine kinase [Calditrichota bacterium]
MKKSDSLFFPIVVFILAHLAWFSLLGLWIYWYVTNYLLLSEVEGHISSQALSGTMNVAILVGGIVLMVSLSVSLSFIFLYYTRQRNMTKLYDNFIANITHELKSPLSSIQLHMETIGKRKIPAEKQSAFYQLILNDIGRLNRLINSILYLSSLEQKKLLKKIKHDYHIYAAYSVIKSVVTEAAGELNLPETKIEFRGNPDCQCVIDRDWLKIVFNNLIDNSIKYSVKPLKISIILCPGLKCFSIEFSDNGIGIKPKDQKIIFQKFQRIYNAESPNVKGTGLGLYWVREIIEYHGGKISVKSPGIGQGTTFIISLPVYMASKKRYIERLLQLSKKEKAYKSENNA